jgi:hypothetical protein
MIKELTIEIYHPRSGHRSRIFAPVKSEVFIITSTQNKHPEEAKVRSN